ncbi:MAG: hypothetical protein M1819_006708 [Sarea resinae]|nr:MAG: hypothetical protein M1819_006708 [Sarea resinae]
MPRWLASLLDRWRTRHAQPVIERSEPYSSCDGYDEWNRQEGNREKNYDTNSYESPHSQLTLCDHHSGTNPDIQNPLFSSPPEPLSAWSPQPAPPPYSRRCRPLRALNYQPSIRRTSAFETLPRHIVQNIATRYLDDESAAFLALSNRTFYALLKTQHVQNRFMVQSQSLDRSR